MMFWTALIFACSLAGLALSWNLCNPYTAFAFEVALVAGFVTSCEMSWTALIAIESIACGVLVGKRLYVYIHRYWGGAPC